MNPATTSEREAARLRALDRYGLLDTPREQDFDEIAEAAAELCETPIAVVNLVGDGRQFFKAEVGLGVRETPLETSFCRQALLHDDFLYVPDAASDPRFAGNPLVHGAAGRVPTAALPHAEHAGLVRGEDDAGGALNGGGI